LYRFVASGNAGYLVFSNITASIAGSNIYVRGYIMGIELVHIGFGNILAMSRVIAIASPNSAPTKRTIHEGRNNGMVIDMTNGRRTKSVIFTDSGHIILAALSPETIASRLQVSRSGVAAKQEQSDSEDEP
jgi:regulator of extracellular matrix RemA (YlzA/DUF370 family)